MRTVFVFIYKERGQNHYLLTHDPYTAPEEVLALFIHIRRAKGKAR